MAFIWLLSINTDNFNPALLSNSMPDKPTAVRQKPRNIFPESTWNHNQTLSNVVGKGTGSEGTFIAHIVIIKRTGNMRIKPYRQRGMK